jgi:mercuric ion binding protein
MKSNITVVILLFITLIFSSCKEKVEQSTEVDLKKVALNIEGMTCEIGCARTIESKLSKTEGVSFAKVSFDKKKGIVEYNANIVSEKEIVNVVEQIAGGDLYKVVEIEKTE